jgi:demethylmenaquinone methyltransferase/2-methoxy-6-polyprenyl-1,4-benzoquinol methylase
VKEYYERRAATYDDWYLGRGPFAERDADAWEADLARLIETLEALAPARTLDVACGTGFLTRHLPGDVVGLDQSATMLAEAAVQAPRATLVRGDGLALPFADLSFDRVFTGHFYGHLDRDERRIFLAEARRLGRELVVADAAVRPNHEREEIQYRELPDGTTWPVLKRYFEAAELLTELGGGETVLDGEWFVVVRSDLS